MFLIFKKINKNFIYFLINFYFSFFLFLNIAVVAQVISQFAADLLSLNKTNSYFIAKSTDKFTSSFFFLTFLDLIRQRSSGNKLQHVFKYLKIFNYYL